ncbi:MAG TPA: AAA family ATPase [Streptosporangiaceae bacterium]|nr:AAA family ATPase [Streptosporangiaceae bacterium]
MDSGLVGRDAEITEIRAFLSGASGAPAVVAITGNAGIGKTAVWQHLLRGTDRSAAVLACRPAPAERPLAFSALDDLFGDVADRVLPALPGPRRRAVELALLRDAAAGSPQAGPEPRGLARGILDALRILAADAPLVIAVDDAQWLDRPSSDVLEFCFRRLRSERITVLMTFRDSGSFPLGLDLALPPDRLGHFRLGPVSRGAIGEIIQLQLAARLPRRTLTRLHEACGGNPFYALEYARALATRQRLPLTSEPIPIPDSLGDLMHRHMSQLTRNVRRVGRLVAASADPRERLIRAACDDQESWAAIDQAIDAGLIERDGEVLRFTHPLLRSALYSAMRLDERRQVHQSLGLVAEDIEERAWHLALGASRPSEEIAGMLERAAEHAAARGAPGEAATLTEQAARLTPAGQPEEARERTVRAADYHLQAGDMARSRDLIDSVLPAYPAGPPRAALLIRLATICYHQSGWLPAERTFRQAAQESRDDPALCAHAEQELAFIRCVAGDFAGATSLAEASLRSAERAADPGLTAHSLARVAAFEFIQGHGARMDLLDRAEALDTAPDTGQLARLPRLDPSLTRATLLKWCDRFDEARSRLADQYRNRIGRGDEASLPFLLYHFGELECWAGNWDAAEEYSLEACRVADESRQRTMKPATMYSLALVRAHRGQVEQARELADEALALCDSTGNVPVRAMVLAVLGFIAVSLGDAAAAHARLGPLAEAAAVAGIGEPGVVRYLPDEIEALADLGEVSLARLLTRELEEKGRSLGRPWALVTAARCHARLAALDGDADAARAAFGQALSRHASLPMPFELGRTLLAQGTFERSSGDHQAARAALGRALGIFEGLGAPLWAAKAHRELSKMAAAPPAGGLTCTERRVAALVTQGRTNREVAAAMFVTENTVQTHLRHIFQKLGVRSRTELAARLLSAPADTAENH